MPTSPAALASQAFASFYGAVVTGGAKALPATATGHLFTVAGGRVIVTSLTGVVSTVIQAQACTISVGNTPTGGSGSNASIATASSSVSGVAVGATFAVPPYSSGAAALVFSGANGILPTADLGISLDDGGLYLVPAGTIDWTTSATNTGAVTWTVTYVPYDAGATVAAA